MLHEGVGSYNGQQGGRTLPPGILSACTNNGMEQSEEGMYVSEQNATKQTSATSGVTWEYNGNAPWEMDNECGAYATFLATSAVEALEPRTIDEARTQPDWPRWDEAIQAELKSLDDAHTWDVVTCPQHTNVVDCKWVFKVKKNAAGEVDKYKAQLVT